MKKLLFALLLLLPAPLWAVKTVQGSFAANTSTGNQTVDTGVDSVLKAIIFYGTQQTATGYADEHLGYIGIATGSSNRGAVAWFSDDAAATTDARTWSADSCILLLTAAGAPDAAADFVSFGTGANAGQFTVNWGDAPASAVLVYYQAFYGGDVQNATVVRHTRPSGTGRDSVTTIGFQPDFIFGITGLQTTPGHTPAATVGIGMSSGWGQNYSVSIGADSGDGAGGYAPQSYRGGQYRNLICLNNSGGVSVSDSFLNFYPSGFKYNRISTAGSNKMVWFLALQGGNYVVGNFQAPTAGGVPQDQSVTTTFLPTGTLFLSDIGVTENAGSNESHLGVGAGWDSSGTVREQTVWGISDNVRAPTVTGQRNANTKVITIGAAGSPPTTVAEADYKTQTSTSFTVTWTTIGATAYRIGYAAFGDEACPQGAQSPGDFVAGTFTSPMNALTSNNLRATETTVNDTMTVLSFNFNIDASLNIDGILLEIEAQATGGTAGDNATLGAQLTWNGGTNETAQESNIWLVGGGDSYQSYGSSSYLWGRSWSVSEFSNANFEVILKYLAEDAAADIIEVDHVRVTVYCSASAGATPTPLRRRRLIIEKNYKTGSLDENTEDNLPDWAGLRLPDWDDTEK